MPMRRRYPALQSFATFSPAVPHLKADLAVCSGLPLLHRTCRNHVPETRCHPFQMPPLHSGDLKPHFSKLPRTSFDTRRRSFPDAAPSFLRTCRRCTRNAALPPRLSKCRPRILQDLPPLHSECRAGPSVACRRSSPNAAPAFFKTCRRSSPNAAPAFFGSRPRPPWWLAPPRPRCCRNWVRKSPAQKNSSEQECAPRRNEIQKEQKCTERLPRRAQSLRAWSGLFPASWFSWSGWPAWPASAWSGLVCLPGLVCMACLACLRWLSLVWPGLPAPRGLLGLPVACSALAALWSCYAGLVWPGLGCAACLWPGLVSLVSARATVA